MSSASAVDVSGGFHAVPDSGEAAGVGLAAPPAASSSAPAASVATPAGGTCLHDEEASSSAIQRYSPLESEASSSPHDAAPLPLRNPRNDDLFFSWMPDASRTLIIQSCYLSVFAVLGALLRIALAQLFGEECRNPGSVGWLAAAEPLCVTANGEAEFEGGIVFADLPANLLGSFVMGFFQPGTVLGLPTDMAVAWLRPGNAFQGWDVLHLAIRTGFCGSLTTFSSWNSEMVVMIYGIGNDTKSQFLRAMLGYIIGVETAVGSFVFGKNVATWIFKKVNPELAREAEATYWAKERGVWIDRTLPTFERRYLPDLDVERVSYYDAGAVAHLERWRVSTTTNRRVGDPMLRTLKEIENATLVQGRTVPMELRCAAENAGWNVDELEAWMHEKRRIDGEKKEDPKADEKLREDPAHVSLNVAIPLAAMVMALLALGVALHNGDDAPSVTYRTMWYAGLFAPFGALLRWRLSRYNGKLPGVLSWFPAGTFAANLLASIISISMIAAELRLSGVDGFWVIGTLRAIKVGFTGCLSTVSTFVAEVVLHMEKPNQYRGYKYILVSLGLCCLFGVAIYGWVVYVI